MSAPDRYACRLRATWEEGHEPARGSRFAEPGKGDGAAFAPTPALVLSMKENPGPSDELSAVLRLSRSLGLPSLYDPDGMHFDNSTPIYADHGGIEVGRGRVVDRIGDRFEFVGWIHPDYADAVRQCGYISPTLGIVAATIEEFGGESVLYISKSELVELSATAYPVRPGTTLSVGHPQLVPSPDWEALQTVFSAFDTWRNEPGAGPVRFAAA